MADKIEITKITLGTKAGIKVELSLDEARELHGQLDELFGKNKVTYIPGNPIIIDSYRPYRTPYGTMCESAGASYSGRSGLTISYLGESTIGG